MSGESSHSEKSYPRRIVFFVYVLLRCLVVITMISQLLNRNFENVYICVLTLILFAIPSLIERRMKIQLPSVLEVVILIFIFAAEILGEIREYYLIFPMWDLMLHTINGFLFAAIGFSLVNILNDNKNITLSLSPIYISLMAFCFSMTIGVLWEFFEWGMDRWFGYDMQKDSIVNQLHSVLLDPQGRNVVYEIDKISDVTVHLSNGRAYRLGLGGYLDPGLQDTMMDLLVNLVGAVVFSLIGYFYIKNRGTSKFAGHFIPRSVFNDES